VVVGIAFIFSALGASAACLTPQWTPQSIATGSLRAGDTAIGDFDGDGLPDIAALAQTAIGQPWTRVLVSRKGAAAQSVYTGTNMVGRLFAADVNGDGRSDIVVADMTAKSVVVLTGRADGTFNAPVTTTLTKTPIALTVADMNGDKKPDVVLYESTTQSVLVLKGDGAAHFTQVESLPLSIAAYSMAAGDFNGDGRTDIAIGHFQLGELTVLLGLGDGTFGGATPVDTGNWPAGVAAGDLDGDGRIDLVTADYADGKVTVLLNDRNLGFKAPVHYNAATNPSGIALADLNGDKKLDIALATLNGDKAMSFTNKGDGTLRAGVPAACNDCNLLGMAAGDLNGDGRADLVTGSSSLAIYRNDCGMSQVTLTPRLPVINALETATFDVAVHGMTDGAPTPTGTIRLLEGATLLGSAKVGTAFVVNGLAASTHEITAEYGGDAEYDPHTSAAAQQVVKALVTTLGLGRTPETSVSGQPVTIVAHASAAPGTVTITVDGVDAKTAAAPEATLTLTPPVGTVNIAARYSGDAVYAPSTAGAIAHIVTKATPTVTAAPLYVAAIGQLAVFAVTVAPPFTGTPTGTVRLLEGNTLLDTSVLPAVLETDALSVGTHVLHVVYDGDAQFNAAESAAFSFTVLSNAPPVRRRAAHH
jgi:hypothetical protein